MLFFKGRGPTPTKAIARAGRECAVLLMENPSLLVELVELIQDGHEWEAHVRVMALEAVEGGGDTRKPPYFMKDPRNPEHNISGNPNAWRPAGMEHDNPEVVEKEFGVATHAGYVMDVPVRDIVQLKAEGLNEEQIQGLRNLYMTKALKSIPVKSATPHAEPE